MSLPSLFISGVEIALQSFPFHQTYKTIGGSALLRLLNGAALKQTHWAKLATTINGDGFVPPGLAAVDWSGPVEIRCVAPRSVFSATINATLPAARRTDFADAVYAMAVVGGLLRATAVSVVGNAATAVAVTGATGYQFFYYPKLNFVSENGVEETADVANADFGWSVSAEEV